MGFPLNAPVLGDPREEMSESCAFAPEKAKELTRAQRVHIPAEKRLEAPAEVRTGPWAQAVALRRDPVVAESGE